jgi:hypothetical protein
MGNKPAAEHYTKQTKPKRRTFANFLDSLHLFGTSEEVNTHRLRKPTVVGGVLSALVFAITGVSDTATAENEGQPVPAGGEICYPTHYAEAGDYSFQNVTDIQFDTQNFSFSNLHPVSTPNAERLASSLTNTTPGTANPNTGLVPAEALDTGEPGSCVSVLKESHIAVDESAAIDGDYVTGGAPIRLFDSRIEIGGPTKGNPVFAGTKECFPTPGEIGDYAMLNVTDIQFDTQNFSFSNLHPVSTPNAERLASSLTNTTPGIANPNTGLVKLEADEFGEVQACVSVLNNSDIAVDYLATIDGTIVNGGAPVRLIDTREDDDTPPPPKGEQGVTVQVACNALSVGDGVQEKNVRFYIPENHDIYDRSGNLIEEGELQNFSSRVEVAFADGSTTERNFNSYYNPDSPEGSSGFSSIHSENDRESPDGSTDQPDPIGFDFSATLKNGVEIRKVVTGLEFKSCPEYNPGEASPQVIVTFEY